MDGLDELLRAAELLHKARLWRTSSPEQVFAVILMGRELGVGPATSLSNIQIAMGRPALGAALVGALIQKTGRYRYAVTEMTDQAVTIEFFDRDQRLGTSRFTLQDAQKAGLGRSDTWQKYSRNMLHARAMTNGARWYVPSIFGGAVYDPDELPGAAPADAEPPAVLPDPPMAPANGTAAGPTITLEGLAAAYGAEAVYEAAGGALPTTDEELRAVAEQLATTFPTAGAAEAAEEAGDAAASPI
jgi:hypothetical protein